MIEVTHLTYSDPGASSALDDYLVVECQLGSTEAFRALVHRWQGPLARRARDLTGDREAALDVVQESWIAVVRGLHGLRDPAHFRSWALRIVANKARDWIRREQSRRRTAGKLALDAASPAPPEQSHVDLERVRTGLAALEPSQRMILRRHYLEGRSVAEIATELGLPMGTVKSRLFNARNELRHRLEED